MLCMRKMERTSCSAQQGNDRIYGGNDDDDLIGGHNVRGGHDGDDRIDGGADVLAGDSELAGETDNDVILGDNGQHPASRRDSESAGTRA